MVPPFCRALAALYLVGASASNLPNIVMILVDDLGFADVGFNRAEGDDPRGEVVTPNIDRLAGEGIALDRHYVFKMCTPTRTSFFSGRVRHDFLGLDPPWHMC